MAANSRASRVEAGAVVSFVPVRVWIWLMRRCAPPRAVGRDVADVPVIAIAREAWGVSRLTLIRRLVVPVRLWMMRSGGRD